MSVEVRCTPKSRVIGTKMGPYGFGMPLDKRILRVPWREFNAAREFARSLNLRRFEDWKNWAKSGDRPSDIPSTPMGSYKGKGWISWGDWLGTYLPFEEARSAVQVLKLSPRSWATWRKSPQRPNNIPSLPGTVYKGKGWKGIKDWLGYKDPPEKDPLLPFEEAREYARSLGLATIREWVAWAKTSQRPVNITPYPSHTYKGKGWKGAADWLGTNTRPNRGRVYLPFLEARSVARSLNLKNHLEWVKWAESGKRSTHTNIPSCPARIYKDKGWRGWLDWLGVSSRKSLNRDWMPFDEAREYLRSLGLANCQEFREWARTDRRPLNIPYSLSRAYGDHKRWVSFSDMLGLENKWSVHTIREYVESLLPSLPALLPAERWVLFQQSGFLSSGVGVSAGQRSISSAHLARLIARGKFPFEELQKFVDGEPSLVDGLLGISDSNEIVSIDPYDLGDEVDDLVVDSSTDDPEAQTTTATEILRSLSLIDSQESEDESAIKFLLDSGKAKLWAKVFNEGLVVDEIRSFSGSGYAATVRIEFLMEYEAAVALEIPEGYAFTQPGKSEITPPNLMQRFIASRIQREGRMGNWSGTGSGKTNSAILASRVVDSKLTLILCPNNVIDGWTSAITGMFPDSKVLSKTLTPNWGPTDTHRYLVLNYEMFQQSDSEVRALDFIGEHLIDFVVIDEVQFVKQRTPKEESLRRRNIKMLLTKATENNPGLYVLGMSATPVINNLREPVALIEMITGEDQGKSILKSTVNNCMRVYQRLTKLGPRWLMTPSTGYDQREISVDCSDYLSEIKKLSGHSSPLQLEEILTKARLPTILDSIVSKTVIYTHYIGGTNRLDSQLKKAVESCGWRVGFFTGEDKTGLNEFLKENGEVDVLIASSAIATGVDRLQYICNRLIINVLPWTAAEFEQLIGRFRRQGQLRDVSVIIPITFAQVGTQEWSWCRAKMHRLHFKKSIADATIDGVLPEGHLITQDQAYRDLIAWLERLSANSQELDRVA